MLIVNNLQNIRRQSLKISSLDFQTAKLERMSQLVILLKKMAPCGPMWTSVEHPTTSSLENAILVLVSCDQKFRCLLLIPLLLKNTWLI